MLSRMLFQCGMTILSMVVVIGIINPWTFIPVVPNSRAVTYVFQCRMTILSMVIVVGIVNPWTFIPVVPMCVVSVILLLPTGIHVLSRMFFSVE